MMIAWTCLVLALLAVWIRSVSRQRPLERSEIHRLRRFSERTQREDSMPFE